MGKMTLDFPAGSAWSYSNTGYMIATDIIELLSKEPYAKFMKSRIFDPLGMRHTSTSDPTRVIPNRARGYLPGASVTNAPVINPTLASGAGNLVSTIDDLAKWEASLQTDKLLNASMREEFFRPYELSTGKDSGYALGWFVRQDRGRPLIEHGGNTVGFSSELYRVPNENVSIIVLTNSGGIGGAQWGRQAVSALLSSYDPNRRKDADPNRDWTAHLTLTLRKWGKNKLDTTYLSSEFQKLLGTTRGLGTRLGLIQIGKIMERCVYLDGEAKGDYRSNRYRFDLPGASAIFEVQFDKAGMITSFDQLYAWRR
jgi:CubicO group peptidase (beta-lactamase class C family)